MGGGVPDSTAGYGAARAVASTRGDKDRLISPSRRAAGRDTRWWMSRRTIVSASRDPVSGIF